MMQTLKEIANEHAKKQPGMVDALTEEAPILAQARWTPASHGLWNNAEVVSDVTGPGFVEMNAPLPVVDVSSNLVKVDVSILGGTMEVPKDTADQFGGAGKYFARKQDKVLKKAGMDCEARLFYDNWRQAALDCGNMLKTTAANGTGYSMLAVRFDQDSNVGIYDPTQFDQGRLLRIDPLNGGSLYHLKNYPGVSGYGVELRGRFGWQILDPKRTVAALVNIQKGKIPTENQIDDLISMVRGTPANTVLIMHALCKNLAVHPYKTSRAEMMNKDTDVNTTVMAWSGIPLLTSYNLQQGTEAFV